MMVSDLFRAAIKEVSVITLHAKIKFIGSIVLYIKLKALSCYTLIKFKGFNDLKIKEVNRFKDQNN